MERILTKSLGMCNTFSKISLLSSILPLSVTSTGELSPIRIGGPFHAFNEEYTTFVEAMLCDAPESTIQSSGEELMATKAWLEFPSLGL
jgi:hypothetical protein